MSNGPLSDEQKKLLCNGKLRRASRRVDNLIDEGDRTGKPAFTDRELQAMIEADERALETFERCLNAWRSRAGALLMVLLLAFSVTACSGLLAGVDPNNEPQQELLDKISELEQRVVTLRVQVAEGQAAVEQVCALAEVDECAEVREKLTETVVALHRALEALAEAREALRE